VIRERLDRFGGQASGEDLAVAEKYEWTHSPPAVRIAVTPCCRGGMRMAGVSVESVARSMLLVNDLGRMTGEISGRK